MPASTRVFTRSDVERLLDVPSCLSAVESAFRQRGQGELSPSGVLGIHVTGGGFHAKAAFLNLARPYFVVKVNANFPGNLARDDAHTATFIGCGVQARAHVDAISAVRHLRHVHVFDIDEAKAIRFASDIQRRHSFRVDVATDLAGATTTSHIIVTSTSATSAFLGADHVSPGAFIAGVGADSEHKQEIDASLLRRGAVVTDDTEQCATIGDLHHAIERGLMTRSDVRATLSEVVAGVKPGRVHDDEIVVFDSTGVAIEDVAAASVVYERAVLDGAGRAVDFAE